MSADASRGAAPARSGVRRRLPTVAFQGTVGSFGEEAVHRLWRRGAMLYPTRSFAAAIDALRCGEVEWAVIPIWNSAIGAITTAHAALDAHRNVLTVARRIALPVRHCLMALPGSSVEGLRYVGSHPAALTQCAKFLAASPWLATRTAYDTAGAARELSRSVAALECSVMDAPWYADLLPTSHHQLGVIASRRAARRFGLSVLAYDIHDDPSNVTHFAALQLAAKRESALANDVVPSRSGAVLDRSA